MKEPYNTTNIMEENKETLEPQELDGQSVTDNVTESVTTPTEEAASPEGKQPAKKRWRFTTERVKVTLLAVIAACLVIIVIQNFFPTERSVRGYVSTYADGGHVNVGGSVSVDNLSDISISMPSSTHGYDYPWSMNPIDVRIVGSSGPLDVNIEKVNGFYVGRSIPVEVNN